MDRFLQESKPRGSFLFPFELYHTQDATGSYYVSGHWHPDTEVIDLRQGSIRLTVDGESRTVGAGTVIFINREEIHGLVAASDEICYDASVFPLEFLSFPSMDYCQQKYLLPLIQKKLVFPRLLEPGHPCYGEVRAQLSHIARLKRDLPDGYQIGIKAALYQILSCLIQAGALKTCGHPGASPGEKGQGTMREILSYVKEHMDERLTLSEMSARFYMTPNSFCRYFKKHLGTGFTEYVNGLRLEKACRLLSETSLPVMEVGFLCGFENFSYFIRLFKRKLGLTPTTYRRNAALMAGGTAREPSVTGQSPVPDMGQG